MLRDEEISLVIGDFAVAHVNQDMVGFSLRPTSTILYIDGEKVDTSVPVMLDYGIHQVIARADNYKSLTSYIKVGQASAGIDITLDSIDTDADSKEEEQEDEVIELNENKISSYYKVYIDSPESLEVYLNGYFLHQKNIFLTVLIKIDSL